jgi:hypothetical protein
VDSGAEVTAFDFASMASVDVEYNTLTSGRTFTATIQNGVLRVAKTGDHSSEVFVLTFNLGTKTLNDFTGVTVKMRAISGDTGYKYLTVEVLNTGSTTFGTGGTNTGLVATNVTSNRFDFQPNVWETKTLPFNATGTVLSARTGEVKIAFGVNNTSALIYEIESIVLVPKS